MVQAEDRIVEVGTICALDAVCVAGTIVLSMFCGVCIFTI
jgi:hypothetical protein